VRWLLDEMLPRTVAQRLSQLGHDAVSVHDVELTGAADDDVFEFAVVQDRLIVTENFADFVRLLESRHPYQSSSSASPTFRVVAASPLIWQNISTNGLAIMEILTSAHIGLNVRADWPQPQSRRCHSSASNAMNRWGQVITQTTNTWRIVNWRGG